MNIADAAKINSMKHWELDGPNRIVKVVSPTRQKDIINYGSALGYVTQEKYLYGKGSTQIESILGLRPGELAVMCYVYALERLPLPNEVEFKFSCAFPDGEPFEAAQASKMMQARADFANGVDLYGEISKNTSMTPVAQHYPPGSGMVPQWTLTSPVPVQSLIATVTPILVFPRPNGSIQPYSPHNRGEIR